MYGCRNGISGGLRWCIHGLLVVNLVGLGGCGTLLQPHMTVPDSVPSGGPDGATLQFHGGISAAIAQAQTLRGQYERGIRDQALARSSLSLFLVPLGAAAFAVGAGGGHAAAATLLGMGAAGAGVYALGTSAISSPRDLVYLAGINALDCTLDATLPLRLTDAQYDALRGDLVALSGALAVAQETGSVDAGLLRRAASALQSAVTLVARLDDGGFLLGTELHRINAAVSAQLLATEPDISTIPTTVAGLKGLAASLAPGIAASTGSTVHANQLNAMHEADPATAPLQVALAAVQLDLAEAALRAKAGGDPARCRVGVPGGLQLGLEAESLSLAPGDSYDIPVLASKSAAPSVNVSGPTGGVTATRVAVGNGIVVRLAMAADAKDGQGPWLLIVDDPGSDTSAQVAVSVAGGSATMPGGGATGRSASSVQGHLPPPASPPVPPPSPTATVASDVKLLQLSASIISESDPAFTARVTFFSGCRQDKPPSTVLTPGLRNWIRSQATLDVTAVPLRCPAPAAAAGQ